MFLKVPVHITVVCTVMIRDLLMDAIIVIVRLVESHVLRTPVAVRQQEQVS